MKRFQYLDYTQDFWAGFVKKGELDTEGLINAGFTEDQHEGIRESLTANGYIKAPVVKALEGKRVDELKKIAEKEEIELPEGAHKDEIVATLASQVDESTIKGKAKKRKATK